MSPRVVVLAVSLPLLALGLAVARSEHQVRTSEEWLFPVSGYDPRDLLRGHYIRYRIDYQEHDPERSCSNDDPNCCLCLERTSNDALTTTRRMTCTAARSSCEGVLQTRRLDGLNRFYVSESRALELEQRIRTAEPGQARIVLAVDRLGRPLVREMRIGDERLE